MDDLNGGGDTREDAIELYSKSSQRMSEGGFTLRKWKTNDPELQKLIVETEDCKTHTDGETKITEDEITYAGATIRSTDQSGSSNSTKVLGLGWDTSTDQLIVATGTQFEETKQPFTKRSLLRATARLYDPLGVIAPIILPMKLLFQQLCVQNCDWDTELDVQYQHKIASWITELHTVQHVKIPRCYLNNIAGRVIATELHGFGDASKSAYAAVVYIRSVTDKEVLVRLVALKTRVAPLAKHSIPRLELLLATILTRLCNTVADALQQAVRIDKVYCWLDSLTALYWIHQENKEWKPFVQNRVSEIRKITPVSSWLHCPSEENMADIASRGASPLQLRHISNLLVHFWNRWQTECLLELREHHNLATRKSSVSAIEQGDIVTIYPERRLPKAKWQLGPHGKVRSAVVRVGNSKGTSSLLRRPIQKLFPLEVRHSETTQSQEMQVSSKESAPRRSTRTAAIVGNRRRQLVDQCLEQD